MSSKTLNKVLLIGFLGKDPEVRQNANNLSIATFSIATNEKIKDGDGWKDRTEWHSIVAWGRQAEIAGEYLSKGTQVYIEGRLQTRSWEGQDGAKRWSTEIIVKDFIILKGNSSNQKSSSLQKEETNPNMPNSDDEHEEEIPF